MKLEHATVTPVVNNNSRPGKGGAAVDGMAEDVRAALVRDASYSAEQGVSVSVSNIAADMARSRQNAAADVDHKKVDAMRTAIGNGSFRVNAGAIADKLLSNAEEILKRQGR
jgi:negative regulator of flagellin synthesis FlgM